MRLSLRTTYVGCNILSHVTWNYFHINRVYRRVSVCDGYVCWDKKIFHIENKVNY